MTVGVIPNTDKDAGFAYTREVCDFLTARGVTVAVEKSVAQGVGKPGIGVTEEALYRDTAFLAVLGGDGTMLRAAHYAAPYGTPMLGINLGTLGYLTDVDRHEGLTALSKALAGQCKREKRLMLEAAGQAADKLPPADRTALNDVCVSRGGFGKLITFSLYINGMLMDTLRADGIIVSTPTGSTAYNLSAGGPILTPDGEMIVVTAVCPHTLNTRPWVIMADDQVEIVPTDDNGGAAAVTLDGETRLMLSHGEGIQIRRAACTATILKTSSTGFYEILRRKIGWNTINEGCRP